MVLQTRDSLGIGICKATGWLVGRKVNRLRQTNYDCDRQTDCDCQTQTDRDRQTASACDRLIATDRQTATACDRLIVTNRQTAPACDRPTNFKRIRCTKTWYRLIGCNHKIRLSLKLGIINHDLLFASRELETSVSLAFPSLPYRIGILQKNVHFDSAPIRYTLQCMALCVHMSNLSFDLHLDSISRQYSFSYYSPLGGRFRPLPV